MSIDPVKEPRLFEQPGKMDSQDVNFPARELEDSRSGADPMSERWTADLLPGGKGDDLTDDEFDPDQLREGILHELEHTSNALLAKEIAKDHLVEDPDYYTKLRQIEGEMGNSLDDLAITQIVNPHTTPINMYRDWSESYGDWNVHETPRDKLGMAARVPEDLPADWSFKVEQDDDALVISLIDPTRAKPIAGITVDKGTNEVSYSYSDVPGWGPLMYEVAMEMRTEQGAGLRSDFWNVSDAARRVWQRFYERPDVQRSPSDAPKHGDPALRHQYMKPRERLTQLEEQQQIQYTGVALIDWEQYDWTDPTYSRKDRSIKVLPPENAQ